jgi:hypothetical protein
MKPESETTVRDYIMEECSMTFFEELTSGSDYWSACYKFVLENSDKKISELSHKQKHWLYRIKTGIFDEALK